MKNTTKVLGVIMAALMLALFCAVVLAVGCNNTVAPKEEKNCYDFHYGTIGTIGSGNAILETEDTVYYLFENYLYFSDKEYKDFMPLCSKPNCDHTDEECDAYVYTKSGIWIYGDHIYYVDAVFDEDDEIPYTEPALWRLKLDGSQHEKVMQLPLPDYGYEPFRNTWEYTYTNKYLRVTNSAYENETIRAGEGDWRTYIIDLDSLKVRDMYSSEEPETPIYSGGPVAGAGTKLYGLRRSVQYPNSRRFDLVVIDLETFEGRIIGTTEANLDYLGGSFMLLDDAFEYICWDPSIGEMSIWRMDLETGENALLAKGSNNEIKGAYMDWTDRCLIDPYTRGDESESGLYVLDADLNEVDRFSYEGVPEEVKTLRIFLQTDSYIFAAPPILMNPDDPNSWGSYAAFAIPTWYIDKSEIGTGNLAWRRWAPDGD